MTEYLNAHELVNQQVLGGLLIGLVTIIAFAGPKFAEIGMHKKIGETSINRYIVHSARSAGYTGLGILLLNLGINMVAK